MINTSANLRNLNETRVEALEALQSVSERLSNILGEVAELPDDGTRKNESGELVNEEGLPIIDITEPIDELDTPSLSAATEEEGIIEEDNYPEPISKLSPEALAISRKHRDEILDLLEEEEAREERRTRQEIQVELQKKREAARDEMHKRMMNQNMDLEKRRRAKELEKKMAKALVSGLGEPEPVVSKPVSQSHGQKKKVVTFADTPSPADLSRPRAKQQESVDWGDVVPGRHSSKQTRRQDSRSQPMKKEVVERIPTSQPSNLASTAPPLRNLQSTEPIGDSDDESDSEVASDSTIALESGDEDIILSAHRHRELALEYHQRRNAMASKAGALRPTDSVLLADHGHSLKWDTEEVPLEATLAHPPPKPVASRFKAAILDRSNETTTTSIAQHNGLPSPLPLSGAPGSSSSAMFGTSVLPPDALARSIKMGKLVDGKLVAGQEDEEIRQEEQEEEEIRRLLLKSVEDYSGIAAQVMGPAASSNVPLEPKPPRLSRFKAERSAG